MKLVWRDSSELHGVLTSALLNTFGMNSESGELPVICESGVLSQHQYLTSKMLFFKMGTNSHRCTPSHGSLSRRMKAVIATKVCIEVPFNNNVHGFGIGYAIILYKCGGWMSTNLWQYIVSLVSPFIFLNIFENLLEMSKLLKS